MRSGMISNDSPFPHFQQYYEKQSSPLRQSLANPKHYSDQQRQYKQITGVESGNNPFTSKIGTAYNQHVSTTQKPLEYSKPYGNAAVQRQNQIYLERFKELISKRGAKGLVGLKRQFKIMDADGSGALDIQEFKRALQDYKVGVTEVEAETLFQIFDKNRDGTIQFEEFMHALLGPMNDFRQRLVKEAF